jgi:hypothetical protein
MLQFLITVICGVMALFSRKLNGVLLPFRVAVRWHEVEVRFQKKIRLNIRAGIAELAAAVWEEHDVPAIEFQAARYVNSSTISHEIFHLWHRADRQRGLSLSQVADLHRISRTTVVRVLRQQQA